MSCNVCQASSPSALPQESFALSPLLLGWHLMRTWLFAILTDLHHESPRAQGPMTSDRKK